MLESHPSYPFSGDCGLYYAYVLPPWERLLACAACWMYQGVGNHQPMRASVIIKATETLAPRILSKGPKVIQVTHSVATVGCTAPMGAIACLHAQLARCTSTVGFQKPSTDARISSISRQNARPVPAEGSRVRRTRTTKVRVGDSWYYMI
jgi:hypothetical protein